MIFKTRPDSPESGRTCLARPGGLEPLAFCAGVEARHLKRTKPHKRKTSKTPCKIRTFRGLSLKMTKGQKRGNKLQVIAVPSLFH